MLPATPSDFSTPSFWRSFFAERNGKPFEWYGSYSDFAPDLARLAPLPRGGLPPRVLVPGCGNSSLSEELFSAGYTRTLSFDFDAGVIAEMRAKSARSAPSLEWVAADAAALPAARFPTGAFDVVVDKGLIDAMVPDAPSASHGAASAESARAYLHHAARVLAPGGSLIIVTLAQAHVLSLLLSSFVSAEAAQLWESAELTPNRAAAMRATTPLCPFSFVVRRSAVAWPAAAVVPTDSVTGARLPVIVRGLDVAGTGDAALSSETIILTASVGADAIAAAVSDVRGAYTVRCGLAHCTGDAHVELDFWLTPEGLLVSPRGERPELLHDSAVTAPTYSITAVDAPLAAKAASMSATILPRAAVVLVPMGREHEWAFGARDGQRDLAKSAGVNRLLVVAFGTGAANAARFRGMTPTQIQAELSPIALSMVPAACVVGSDAIPFLSVAADLGERVVVAEGVSRLAGAWFVEDVIVDDDDDDGNSSEGAARLQRRLIFASNRAALQSEVSVSRTGVVDHTRPLCFEYHGIIARATDELFSQGGAGAGEPRMPVLVVGLGGGALPAHLALRFPWLAVTAVELDAEIVSVAEAHFALPSAPAASRVQMTDIDAAAAAGGGAAVDEEGGRRVAAAARALGGAFSDTTCAPPGSVRVVVGDGLQVIQLLANAVGTGALSPHARPRAVILDVNASAGELASGISFPPPAFLTPDFLGAARTLLAPDGLLMLNCGARSAARRREAEESFAEAFAGVPVARISPSDDDDDGGDLNAVLLAGEALGRVRDKKLAGARLEALARSPPRTDPPLQTPSVAPSVRPTIAAAEARARKLDLD